MTSEDILAILTAKGLKQTKLRALLLRTLLNSASPLSAKEILAIAAKNKIKANKTSVYRQLLTLKNERVVREVQLGENQKRYEIFPENHHHHIVCLDCGQIEDVETEGDLAVLERKIGREKKFQVQNHSLEFFGICAGCRS